MPTNPPASTSQQDPAPLFEPADDPLMRLQRKLGLTPPPRGGPARRALLFALVSGAPIAVWAALRGRLLPGSVAEPYLAQYPLLVRSLIALPAMVVAEAMVTGLFRQLLPYLADSGIVADGDRGRFRDLIASTRRWRDHVVAWTLIVGLAWIGAALSSRTRAADDELAWSMVDGRMAFGGWWTTWVAKPLFLLMLLAWVWRLTVTTGFFLRFSRLDLKLVAMHPDGVGGLGPLRRITGSLGALVFAIASVVAASVAHNVVYHGAHVASFKGLAAVMVLVLAVLAMSPLLPFGGPLRRLRRHAQLEYGALVHRHGGLVHSRWIEGRVVGEDAILTAPELGPVADVGTLYQQVARMRTTLIGKQTVIAAVLPTALPILVVAGLEVPIKDLLQKLLSALV